MSKSLVDVGDGCWRRNVFEVLVTVLTVIVQTTTVNINCGFIDMVQDMNFKNLSRKPYHITFLESLNGHRIVRFNPGGWSLTFTKWSARMKNENRNIKVSFTPFLSSLTNSKAFLSTKLVFDGQCPLSIKKLRNLECRFHNFSMSIRYQF